MNSAQVIAFQPGICVKNYNAHVFPRIRCIGIRDKPSFRLKSLRLKPLRASGKGMMGNSDEDSTWKSLTNAMEKFKGESIEEELRKQIQKGDYYDNGGSGVKPPGGGGGDGGAGGGRPDGTDGSDDASYDTRQAIFATCGLIFLYIYLITGKELLKVILDFLRFIVGGGQSRRIRKIMVNLGQLYKSTQQRKVTDENYLEKAILNTPTWWYDPRDFRRAVKNYYASNSDE